MITYKKWLSVLEDCSGMDKEEIIKENPLDLDVSVETTADKISELIWAAANNSIQALIETTGMTGYRFAAEFGLKERAVHYWIKGERKASDYVTRMFAYILVTESLETKRVWFVQNCYPGTEDLTFFSSEDEALEYGQDLWEHRSEQEKARYRKNAGGEWRLSAGTIEVPTSMDEDEYWDEVLAQDYGVETKDFVS
ncbi:hypothetical protein [Faecalibaculum rodentium]|uniref:hypothetical protein n=2 Tax=Faecalibaculum rodentium TaxID=1702221 RepID=UPI0025975D69|nr:hypothetical protein [Faecalibaculum rodentium]